jgi:hypothetical protein
MSEHVRGAGPAEEAPHGEGAHVEAAQPDRASYPWSMTVIAVFLVVHLTGLVVLWLWFQRQSEETVAAQVLTRDNPALLELRQREATDLTSYGVVDRAQGLYRVPIDRGIGLYLDTVHARAAAGEPMRIGSPPAATAAPPPANLPTPATSPSPGSAPAPAGAGGK